MTLREAGKFWRAKIRALRNESIVTPPSSAVSTLNHDQVLAAQNMVVRRDRFSYDADRLWLVDYFGPTSCTICRRF